MNELWKKIEFKKDSVKVSGRYYTSIRSVHYNESEKIARLSYQSDRCTNKELLNYLYQELPQLKNMEIDKVFDDNFEWLCDWNMGKPSSGSFMIVVLFFK